MLLLLGAAVLVGAKIPTHPLVGGGTIPMLAMGGNDFAGWFKAAGTGAMIQTFHGYRHPRIMLTTVDIFFFYKNGCDCLPLFVFIYHFTTDTAICMRTTTVMATAVTLRLKSLLLGVPTCLSRQGSPVVAVAPMHRLLHP